MTTTPSSLIWTSMAFSFVRISAPLALAFYPKRSSNFSLATVYITSLLPSRATFFLDWYVKSIS